MRRLVLMLLLTMYCFHLSAVAATVVNGRADLRDKNLNEERIRLEGDWRFYWQELKSPQEIFPEGAVFSHFPRRWNDLAVTGHQAFGYATYVLHLNLPAGHAGLGLWVPDVYTAYKLYVNGKPMLSNGEPGKDAAGTQPHWQTRLLDLHGLGDSLQLVLQIANFHHSKGGPYKNILIGDYQGFKEELRRDRALDWLMSGALLMGGLFFFGLYLFGKYDKAMLFFALYCVTYSYRPVGSRLYALHEVLPELSWFLTVRLEYFSLFAAIGFFALYTLYLYPRDANRHVLNLLAGFCFVSASTTLFLEPYNFTQTLNPFLIAMFAVVMYTTWVYIRAVRMKRAGSAYALASTAVVMVVMILINLEYFQLLVPASFILFAGYFAFLFLQSLVLAYRFSNILDRARQQALIGLRVKTEFLSTMSHEIRTPLNAVIGMTHLLLKSNPRPDQQEQLQVMLFSSRNLLNIVNDILDYNKIEEGKIKFEQLPVDMHELLQNILAGLRTQAEEKGLKLMLHPAETLKSKVLCDPTRMAQVVNNLVQNAVKFTKTGRVDVRVEVLQQAATSQVLLRISVEDTGIGIPADKLNYIFERFTQADSSTSRSYGGTGLGLAISRRILELQNSRLEVSSEQGKGSKFWFDISLPVTDLPAERQLSVSGIDEDAGVSIAGMKVLLVEDNVLNIKVAQAFLQRWGTEVDVAKNGQEALDMLDVNKHQVILMDLHMPVMDGYTATRLIREKGIRIPIIALTASLPKDDETDVRRIGLDDVIIKPFNPEELRKAMWLQVNKRN